MIDRRLDRRFPDVAHMEEGARRRIPRFAFEYLIGGIGGEAGVRRNREALDEILLSPRYIQAPTKPDHSRSILGYSFDAPFGVAPLGLSGLMWPQAAQILAKSARAANLPFALSTFATASLERIASIGGEHAWFQLYPPNQLEVERAFLERLKAAGYSVLIVTVDTPGVTRRPRDVRNGLSVPPHFDLGTMLQAMARPAWAFAQLLAGRLSFENVNQYVPPGLNLAERAQFLVDFIDGHVSLDHLKRLRDSWPGKLLVKGILDPADAHDCVAIGADGLIVSNHGGRQLDAAPASVSVLPAIRAAVGDNLTLIADGGIRSGLDIARMMALGADFTLLGRAFVFAVSVAGERGAQHLMGVLKEELRSAMVQIGCPSLKDLPAFLSEPPAVPSLPAIDTTPKQS